MHDRPPCPGNILLFCRLTKNKLQQEALQNRSHHRFVLLFNFETRGHVHVNHLSLPFCPGQALLIHPYQFHHFSHLNSVELKWLFCTFELEKNGFLDPLRNRLVDISNRTIQARNLLIDEWLRCKDPAQMNDLQDAQLEAALVRVLLCLRQDLSASSSSALPDMGNSLFRKINRLLSEMKGRPVTVSDLAEGLHLSSSRLRTVFKEMAGVPLGSYIQNYRINQAMELLRTTDLPIAEIAEESGFGSPQSFSRIFKNRTGESPRSYRKKGSFFILQRHLLSPAACAHSTPLDHRAHPKIPAT